MRVLIVDDSAFMRRAISQMLSTDPEIQVVGIARNGKEGVEMAQSLQPDVITMDIEMPVMDGLTALQRVMRQCPTQVLMLSSLTTEGSHAALRAMSLGAADVLAKDTSQVSLSITNIQADLIARVRALGLARLNRLARIATAPPAAPSAEIPQFRPGQFDVICIGSSTGGPPVLETILTAQPASLTAPIVVAQHMPALFTASMAQRLGELCRLRVVEAADHMPLERRSIYISPGGKHTHLHRLGLARWELLVNGEPQSAPYRPSVDALFSSAAEAMKSRVLAVILTGMGNDGFEGARLLHAQGAVLLAQTEETCVVYGMPKGITEQAWVAASLPPVKIAQCLRSVADARPASQTAGPTPPAPAAQTR
jgi:two-component system chemotaxis response regulator CheB